MIAGKTHSEIQSMNRLKRCRWYKTILPEEKEEAMKMMEKVKRVKNGAAMMGENNPMRRPEVRAKISGENSSSKRPEVRAKLRALWTPERKIEQREAMIGENNPMKRPEVRVKFIGENNPRWQGGISFEPYGIEFNDELKNQIRERDNHTCQECHYTEEQLGCTLDVHHIDYDKTNNSPENLISLCRSCHSQTNFGREEWAEYFGKIMEGDGG